MNTSLKIAGLICFIAVILGGIILYLVMSSSNSGTVQSEVKQMKGSSRGRKAP